MSQWDDIAHQSERRPLISPGLDQHVKNFTLGVDGAPQIDHAAIDFQIDFVEMPSCRGLGRRLRRSAAIFGPNRSLSAEQFRRRP